MVFEEAVVLSGPFSEVLDRVKEAFAAEGFGTLTEIDVQSTLKEKLDKDMGRYVIVGSCNPELASRALDAVPQVGVLLPCNVVVREAEDDVMVEAMDPGIMAAMTDHQELVAIADEARRLVGQALNRLS